MSVVKSRGMVGTLKKFDADDHGKYDQVGRDAMKKFLNRVLKENDLKTIDNPNIHGIDLLSLNSKNEVVCCWEIEVRHGNWQGDIEFPFRDINCIERKDYQWRREKEFISKIPFTLAEQYFVYYVQLNRECNRAVVIDSRTILKYPLKPWSNRKAEGEYVRQVPISETIQKRI
jgi:hypothetical protein